MHTSAQSGRSGFLGKSDRQFGMVWDAWDSLAVRYMKKQTSKKPLEKLGSEIKGGMKKVYKSIQCL